jgi:Bacterial regulatory proteins, luxR family
MRRELAASGLTSRDIAAAGFISPKTVEANLARVYSNWASVLETNSAESSLSKSTTNGTITQLGPTGYVGSRHCQRRFA